MIAIRAFVPLPLLFLAAFGFAPVAGCAGLRLSGPEPRGLTTARDTIPLPRLGADVEARDPRSPAVLAAVEAFLEQTQEFELPPVANPPAARPTPTTAPGVQQPAHRTLEQRARPVPPSYSTVADKPVRVVANAQVALPDSALALPGLALPIVQAVSIRPVVTLDAPTPQRPVTTSTSNEPLGVPSVVPAVSVDGFIGHLHARANNESDFDSEWQLRLVQLAFDRTPQPLERSDLSRDAGRFLASLVRAAQAVRRAARNPLMISADLLQPIEELRRMLADWAGPLVTTVTLCRKVVTFGVYEVMAPRDFVSGRTIQTIVYCEIRNLRATQTEEGRYRTQLATRVEVLSADGKSVWKHEEPEIVDVCRQRRRDFFIAQRVTLPPTLPAGDYVLKVLVEDATAGQAHEASTKFSMLAASTVATKG